MGESTHSNSHSFNISTENSMVKAQTPDKGQVLLYKDKLEVRLEQETVWLTQKDMSELFNTERSVITKHLRNIFKEKELKQNLSKVVYPGLFFISVWTVLYFSVLS